MSQQNIQAFSPNYPFCVVPPLAVDSEEAFALVYYSPTCVPTGLEPSLFPLGPTLRRDEFVEPFHIVAFSTVDIVLDGVSLDACASYDWNASVSSRSGVCLVFFFL